MDESRTLVLSTDQPEYILLPADGVINLTLTYSGADRQRNAVSSLMFRVRRPTVVPSEQPSRSDQLSRRGFYYGPHTTEAATTATAATLAAGNPPSGGPREPVSPKAATAPAVVSNFEISTTDLGQFFLTHLVDPMTALQSDTIRYQGTKIEVFDAAGFNTEGVTEAKPEFVLSRRDTYNLKAEGVTGRVTDLETNHKSYCWKLYGKGLDSYTDNPRKFLVAGVTMKNDNDPQFKAYRDNIYKFLRYGAEITSKEYIQGYSIKFVPVVFIGHQLREVAVVQTAGLRNVAGSGSRRQK